MSDTIAFQHCFIFLVDSSSIYNAVNSRELQYNFALEIIKFVILRCLVSTVMMSRLLYVSLLCAVEICMRRN